VTRTELARAKVNLFLHVGRPGSDGYHDISSLMVFADVGDQVTLRPGESGFEVTGPYASDLSAEGDNLVTRARDLYLARFGGEAAFGITLEKTLPIAAGLGGGSADAAAALRLLARAADLPSAERRESGALGEIARRLGADVAACLASAPIMAEGRGDMLTSAPPLPRLHAVLVNPREPSPTALVYRAFDDDHAWGALATPIPSSFATAAETVRWLTTTRNDLEGPATRLCPAIGDVLALLRRSTACLFARMSGSGATCFALCAGEAEAAILANDIAQARPGWWVTPCRLGPGEE
jgi:4-diphosphocytidyl-2-C-methyl-D-erythritol kinase